MTYSKCMRRLLEIRGAVRSETVNFWLAGVVCHDRMRDSGHAMSVIAQFEIVMILRIVFMWFPTFYLPKRT